MHILTELLTKTFVELLNNRSQLDFLSFVVLHFSLCLIKLSLHQHVLQNFLQYCTSASHEIPLQVERKTDAPSRIEDFERNICLEVFPK